MHSVLSTLVTILTTIDSLLLLTLYWRGSGCERCPLLHQYFDGNYQRLEDATGCWQLVKLKMVKSCQSSAYTISWLSKSTKCLVYCVFGNICHSFDLMAATGRGSGCVCRTRYNNMANRVIYWMFYDTFCIRPNILQSAHLQFYFRGPSCKASRKRAGSNNNNIQHTS